MPDTRPPLQSFFTKPAQGNRPPLSSFFTKKPVAPPKPKVGTLQQPEEPTLARLGQGIADFSGFGGLARGVAGGLSVLEQPLTEKRVIAGGQKASDLIAQAHQLPIGSLQRTALLKQAADLTNKEEELASSSLKSLKESPTLLQTLGSGGKLALTVATFGGAGMGGSLGMQVLKNAALGAGFGVSEPMEEGKTLGETAKLGLTGAAIGASIPVFGKAIEMGSQKWLPKFNKMMEKLNFRLTPTQKRTLGTKIDDATNFMTRNKIIGSPEKRYDVVNEIYHGTEEKLQNFLKVDLKGRTIAKDAVINELNNVKRQFANERDVSAIHKQIDGLIDTIQTRYPTSIPAWKLNFLKRSTYENAFNRAGDKVLDEVEFAMGDKLRGMVEAVAKGITGQKLIDGMTLGQFNKQYGTIITTRKLLRFAAGRNQLGMFGRFLSTIIGGGIGTAVGGPIGTGVGALTGHTAGEALAGTAARSLYGAAAQKVATGIKKVLPVAKKIGTILIGQR